MVCYGVEKVFSFGDSMIIDEDIDCIIVKGEEVMVEFD